MMSYKKTPYRDKDKDKRSLLLEKESEKLRREISELEDALILHSRFEKDRDETVRGLIRKEIGGSHWEHGGDGKLHSYRSYKDLHEESNVKRKLRETQHKKRTKQHEARAQSWQEPAQKSKTQKAYKNVSPTKQSSLLKLGEVSHKRDKCLDLEISSVKAEWRSSQKKEYSNRDSNSQMSRDPEETGKDEERISIKDLKSKVLAKASAKISNRSDSMKNNYVQKKNLSAPQESSNSSKTLNGCRQNMSSKDKSNRDEKTEDLHRLAQNRDSLSESSKRMYIKQNEFFNFKETLPLENDFSVDGRIQPYLFDLSQNEKQDKTDNFMTNENYPKTRASMKETFPWSSLETNPQLKANRNPEMTKSDKQEEERVNNTQNTNNSDPSEKECTQLDEEVCLWLQNLGLHSTEFYKELFAFHQMDMASIKLLTSTQLREMGIHALGPIMKIIKGVQILGRRNSTDDGKCNGACFEKDVHFCDECKPSQTNKTTQSVSVYDAEDNQLDIQDEKEHKLSDSVNQHKEVMLSDDKNDMKSQDSESSSNTPKGEKTMQSNEAKWKETFDEAEFLNLQDRSPTANLEAPLLVAVKEADNHLEHQTSPKISKQARKPCGKPSRKPPVSSRMTDDGILRAAQKISEKHKQQHDQEHTEGRSRTRRKELRDEMAARHHIRRRSASMDRDTPSPSPKPSLERSSSFNGKMKKKDRSQPSPLKLSSKDVARGITINMKDRSHKNENELKVKHHTDGMRIDEIVSVLKDIPDENCKSQDENHQLTLGVVRELQKQLTNLEQHLVLSQDDKEGTNDSRADMSLDPKLNRMSTQEALNSTGHNIREMSNTTSCVSKEETMTSSGRKSARERRREKLDLDVRESKSTMGPVSELSVASCEKVPEESALTNVLSPHQSHSNLRRSKNSLIVNENLKQVMTSVSVKTFQDLNKTEGQELKHDVTDSREVKRCSPKPTDDRLGEDLHYPSFPYKTQRKTKMSKLKNTETQESMKKIEIHSQDVSFEKKDILGEGVFSQVFKGSYQGSHVAIKVLRAPLLSGDKNYFFAEVSLLKELRHPHVVMLLGVCTSTTQPIMVLELMEGGNLFSRLHNETLPHLLKGDFYQIAHDIASGVSYLHHHKPPVLHLDLKSKNILLGYGNRAKVADFGFSKLKHEADIKISRASKPSALLRSPAWMAPELLAAGEITAKADVYSFSIVLWEMMTREHPYDGFSMFQVLEHLRLNRRPTVPSGYPQELIQLITKCWEQNPAARPSFKDILKSVDKTFSNIEWIPWPDNEKPEENEDKMSLNITPTRNSIDNTSNEINKCHIQKEKKDECLNTVNDESMDVRSICSEDIDSLSGDEDKVDGRCSNNSENEKIEQVDSEKDSVLHNSSQSDADTENKNTNLLRNSSQPLKSISLISNANVSHPYSSTVRKSSKSPVLVPSPRIKEMARKQAAERSSSVFLSLSMDNRNESGLESSQSLRAAAYQNEDAELETLIHKYLPSPRNKSLMKQVNTAHSMDVTDKLLPLRQSMRNKPKKPPKPSKMQIKSIPSQSLNLDHLSSFPKGQGQPWDNEYEGPSSLSSNIAEESHKKDGKGGIKTGDDAMKEGVKFMNSQEPKNSKSFKYCSSSMESSPRLENSVQFSHLSGASSKEISNNQILVQRDKHKISYHETKSNEHNKIAEKSNEHISSPSSTTSTSMNSTEIQLLENTEEINSNDRSRWLNSNEMKNPVDIGNGYEVQQFTKSSVIIKESSSLEVNNPLKENESSLPADAVINDIGTNVHTDEYETSHGHCMGRQDHHGNKSSLSYQEDLAIQANRQVTPMQQKYQSLPVHSTFCQPDRPDEIDSDVGSSTCSDFSADSLSLTLSDDVDSVDSIEEKNIPRKAQRLKTKKKKKNANDIYNSEKTADKNLVSSTKTIGSQETRSDGNLRESFFLFDDFQGIPNNQSKVLPNFGENVTVNVLTDSKVKNSNMNILDTKVNSSKSRFHLQQADLINGKLNLKQSKSNAQTASKQQSYPHDGHILRKVDNAENFTHERLVQPKWSNPHISNDEPEVRPSRNVQFSLDANMLAKQKRQLKSVAVQEQPPINEIKKGVKGSLPSFANILKKAIEERRFALGDHIESQDMTPEASWSLQED